MREIPKAEFLAEFDDSIHSDIEKAFERYPDCEALVMFENQDFCSSEFGRRQCLVVGPSNTFKSVEDCKGKWLNDLPSQRQYPASYCLATNWK